MKRVQLIDQFGFTISKPEVPTPLPKIIAWGDDFFIAGDEERLDETADVSYYMTSGYVLPDTRESGRLKRGL